MDLLSGASPSPDPCLALSQEPAVHNAELPLHNPTSLSSDMAFSFRDPASKQLPNASSSLESRVSAEKAPKSVSASSKKSASGEARASGQNKSAQTNKTALQKGSVQWVRVSPVQSQVSQKSGNPVVQEAGALENHGSKACEEPLPSCSEKPQNRGVEEIKVYEECIVRLPSSSSHVSGQVEESALTNKTLDCQAMVLPSSSDDQPHQGAAQEQDHKLSHQAAQDDEISSQAVEELQVVSSSTILEDDQSGEMQKSLSRTSSLSAKAKEFVPKSVSAPSAPIAAPTMPPAMHVPQVMPPLMIPLNPAPGILSIFPPSSPLPSPQLGGFPIPMAGPPPPPIPASLMGPMPLLAPPHPGLLNVQLPGPPLPPAIPPPAYIIHSPSSSVPPPLQPASMVDPLANRSVKTNVVPVQDHVQAPQDSELASSQGATSKPILTEELKAKIVKQVEFYFCDANLPTDYHLMKYVKKDPEGFVPIAVVASFRKVKSLLKNVTLVAAALRSSKQLVVSQDGKKVRRLHPLPHVDLEEIQSRTVVAENLPADHSIEGMEQLFSSVGNVKMVRVCEPEASNGANQTSAKFIKADMVVSNKLHALVEFETLEQAERAVLELTDQRNWRSGLHVRLLLRRTNKHALIKTHKGNEGADGSGAEDESAPLASDSAVEATGEDGPDKSEERMGSDSCHFEVSSKKGRGRGRGRVRGRGQFHPNGGRSHPVGTPPQVNSLVNIEVKPPLGPRMPDGTRGFTLGRGRVASYSV